MKNINGKDPYGVDLSKSYIDACSATDCTGLIPSLPQSEAELESYENMYHYLPEANAPEAGAPAAPTPEVGAPVTKTPEVGERISG